jgi:hypothetical protein
MCVCVCVCVCARARMCNSQNSKYTLSFMSGVCVHMCVCVCVRARVCVTLKRVRAHAHASTHAPQHGDCIVNAKQVLRKSAELEAKAQSEYAREQGGVLAHGARTHTPMREPMGIYSKHPEDAR